MDTITFNPGDIIDHDGYKEGWRLVCDDRGRFYLVGYTDEARIWSAFDTGEAQHILTKDKFAITQGELRMFGGHHWVKMEIPNNRERNRQVSRG